eukprot:m.264514 g.264514  ORF g.264514 m.264514 type:complete len:97 (+) comp28250_c0_seq1:654-944(+)
MVIWRCARRGGQQRLEEQGNSLIFGVRAFDDHAIVMEPMLAGATVQRIRRHNLGLARSLDDAILGHGLGVSAFGARLRGHGSVLQVIQAPAVRNLL